MRTLKVGDRVGVVDDYFVEHLRGAIGTITTPEPYLQEHIANDAFWVEFDTLIPDETGGQVEASTIAEIDLRLIP